MTQPNPNPNSSEPLAFISILTAGVAVVITALVAFGLPITEVERDSILAAVGPLSAVVVWVWGRRKVYSPATVAKIVQGSTPSGEVSNG